MYRCSVCGYESPKWTGQCPGCSQWNTFEEKMDSKPLKKQGGKKISKGAKQEVSVLKPEKGKLARMPVKSSELSGVLGGGIVPGSFILLSGEPGIGKSTLTLQLADWCAKEGQEVLYISGEEGQAQISDRAHRLKVDNKGVHFLHAQILEDIFETLGDKHYPLVIVDSVSVMYSQNSASGFGSVGQIRVIAEAFMEFSKRTNTAVILIGHVTKDGDLAGPKTLEHLVDTVLFLEGSKHESYRILRTLKNRFGATDEVGIFQMGEGGLSDVENPGMEFLSGEPHIGAALGVTLEGTRPIVVEIEALTNTTKFGYPKRSVRGMPSSKVDLLLAVASKFGGAKLESDDVYVNVSRGFSVAEPAIDLATMAAILSSKKKQKGDNTVYIGEISLTGQIRSATQINKRLEEIDKLGFKKAIVANASKKDVSKAKLKNLKVQFVGSVKEFVTLFSK